MKGNKQIPKMSNPKFLGQLGWKITSQQAEMHTAWYFCLCFWQPHKWKYNITNPNHIQTSENNIQLTNCYLFHFLYQLTADFWKCKVEFSELFHWKQLLASDRNRLVESGETELRSKWDIKPIERAEVIAISYYIVACFSFMPGQTLACLSIPLK